MGVCVYVGALALPPGMGNGALELLAAAAALALVVDPRTPRRETRPLLLVVGAFLLSVALSAFGSVDPARSLVLSVPLVPGLLVFLLACTYFEARDVRALYATLSAVSLVVAGHLLWVAAARSPGGPPDWAVAAGATIIIVPNDVIFFAVALSLSLALLLDSPARWLTVLGALAALADVAVVVVYRSRGGLLTLLVVVALWASRLARRRGAALLGGAALLALGVDAACGFPLSARFAETWTTRIPLWLAAVEMFRDAPWLGNGPRSFGVLLGDYLKEVSVPGWIAVDPRLSAWAHDLYLETLAEQGIVGLAVLVALLGLFLRQARRLLESTDRHARTLGTAAGVALVALCVGGVFELSFIRLWVVVVLFAVLGSIAALSALDEVDR